MPSVTPRRSLPATTIRCPRMFRAVLQPQGLTRMLSRPAPHISRRNNHTDAIVSLDMTTGAVKWSTSGIPFDSFYIWTASPNCCLLGGSSIHRTARRWPAPIMTSVRVPCSTPSTDRISLAPVRRVASSGPQPRHWCCDLGNPGCSWRHRRWFAVGLFSTDGKNIYFASANTNHKPWVVNGNTITSGSWGALDAGHWRSSLADCWPCRYRNRLWCSFLHQRRGLRLLPG